MNPMDQTNLPNPSAPPPASTSGGEPGPERGRRLCRNLVAVGAAIGLSLGGLGIAAAQTDSSTSTTAALAPATPGAGGHTAGPLGGRGHLGAGLATAATAIGVGEADLLAALRNGQSIAQVAQASGVDPAKVVSALVEEAKARLAAEVTAGRLTQAQADERTATLQGRITEHVNRPGGLGQRGHGPRRGPGLAVAARAIGASEAELQAAVGNGQSIAQVARSKGVDPAVVITAIVEDAKAKMAERAATLQQRVTDQVNRAGGPGGHDRP